MVTRSGRRSRWNREPESERDRTGGVRPCGRAGVGGCSIFRVRKTGLEVAVVMEEEVDEERIEPFALCPAEADDLVLL
jgi:hypothetical protein